MDVAIDAPIDMAPGITKFDVGYINDITFVPVDTTGIPHFLLVVNKGTVPLDLATATVVTYNDGSDGIDSEFHVLTSSTFKLDPERAAGNLGVTARNKLVTDQVVTERIDDNILDFELKFVGTPASGVVANAQAVLSIGGVDAVLPFKITTIPSGSGPPFQFNSAKRVHSQ